MPGSSAAETAPLSAILRRGLRVLAARRPGVLLDAGCGAGRESAALAAATQARVIALDIDASALARAPRSPGVSYLRADATRLPLASGSLDAAFSFGLLQALGGSGTQRIRAALQELGRALRPDGIAILGTLADFRRHDAPARSLTGAEVSQVMGGALALHELIGLRDSDSAGRQTRYWYVHARRN